MTVQVTSNYPPFCVRSGPDYHLSQKHTASFLSGLEDKLRNHNYLKVRNRRVNLETRVSSVTKTEFDESISVRGGSDFVIIN